MLPNPSGVSTGFTQFRVTVVLYLAPLLLSHEKIDIQLNRRMIALDVKSLVSYVLLTLKECCLIAKQDLIPCKTSDICYRVVLFPMPGL